MLTREVLRQIRRLHFKARRAVEGVLGGEYRSVFKGSGLVFEEVREYEPGDDVRSIDWNVTARMGHPFVKRYVEERELNVLLLVDWSGSQRFGTRLRQKREVAAELAAVLAFSAVSNSDRVGLIGFTDRVERFVPPGRGPRHALRLIRDVLFFQPAGRRTSIRAALEFLGRIQHRRAVVFILSDFMDAGFEGALNRAGRFHDVIAVRITDPAEESLPTRGLVRLRDAETGRRITVDAGSRIVRDALRARADARTESLRRLTRSARTDLVEVSTAGDHLDALVRFFRLRERRTRSP